MLFDGYLAAAISQATNKWNARMAPQAVRTAQNGIVSARPFSIMIVPSVAGANLGGKHLQGDAGGSEVLERRVKTCTDEQRESAPPGLAGHVVSTQTMPGHRGDGVSRCAHLHSNGGTTFR